MSKNKQKKYYARFYETGQIRVVKASTLEEAMKKAEEMFDESLGHYTVGLLPHAGDRPRYPGANLMRIADD